MLKLTLRYYYKNRRPNFGSTGTLVIHSANLFSKFCNGALLFTIMLGQIAGRILVILYHSLGHSRGLNTRKAYLLATPSFACVLEMFGHCSLLVFNWTMTSSIGNFCN